ncbi:MAG: hypothetical protein KAJ59_01190 [Thermodesulfovibrionia bacterium]|nr:hypothetical protein [Thermodesulfovibrionia bacterium]
MKHLRILFFTIILMFCFSAGTLYAGEPEVTGSASVDVMSNYVWRGIKLSNGYVVQPSVGITYGGFGANLWFNWDSDCNLGTDTCNDNGELTETDLTLNYSFSVDKVSFDAGYIYYALEAANDTQEIYISAGYDVLLNPAITIYYDFEEGSGAFIIASIGHSLDVSKGIALNLGASASYNIENAVMGTDADSDEFSNFYNGELSVSLNIPVTDFLSVAPNIAYSFPLSNDAENAIEGLGDDGDSSIFYGGINLTLSF